MQIKLLEHSLEYLFILSILKSPIRFKRVPDTAFHYPLQHLATHCEFLAFCVKPKPNKDEQSQQSFFSIFAQLVFAQNTGLGPTSVPPPNPDPRPRLLSNPLLCKYAEDNAIVHTPLKRLYKLQNKVGGAGNYS